MVLTVLGCQNNVRIDPLKRSHADGLNKEAFVNRYRQPDSCIALSERALQYVQDSLPDYVDGSLRAMNNMAFAYYQKSDYANANLMLDRVATVDSAIDLLKDYDIDFSCGTYQFFISEKKGKSAIIEYVGGSMSVIYHKSGVFHQICTNRMEDPSLRAAEKDYSNRYEENTLYTVFDRDLTASYDSGLGQALSYMKLLMIDKSSPMKTVDEYHAGTDQYGTLYIVLYDFLRMKMHVIVKGDTKSQSYTYDLQ